LFLFFVSCSRKHFHLSIGVATHVKEAF